MWIEELHHRRIDHGIEPIDKRRPRRAAIARFMHATARHAQIEMRRIARVDDDRVRSFEPGEQRTTLGHEQRCSPVGGVDVQPCTRTLAPVGKAGEIVDEPSVGGAGRRHDDADVNTVAHCSRKIGGRTHTARRYDHDIVQSQQMQRIVH